MGQPNQQASAPTAELGHLSFPGQGTIEDNSQVPHLLTMAAALRHGTTR